MIEELTIDGYRCFDKFRMAGLGCINLIVGRNNSGKTALLEAIGLVSSRAHRMGVLGTLMTQRGEILPGHNERSSEAPECAIAHLFHGRAIGPRSRFSVEAFTDGTPLWVQGEIVPLDRNAGGLLDQKLPTGEHDYRGSLMAFRLKSNETNEPDIAPLTQEGGFRPERATRSYREPVPDETVPQSTFLGTDSLSAQATARYWNSIALTVEEDLVIRAMRVLEPSIQRIAVLPQFAYASMGRGGVLVKCRGMDRPVPIGSLGDGMWRMFCIAVALVRARGGVLLIDEIDTGFHYSVLEEMWRMLLHNADRLKVQVFATTHSSDCINSLANVCGGHVRGEVSMQRIEGGKPAAVAYSEDEIWAASQHGIETR